MLKNAAQLPDDSPTRHIDVPPIGYVQLLVLDAIKRLGTEASGRSIIELLERTLGAPVEGPQVYVALKKLAHDGHIAPTRKEKVAAGPPRQFFALTAKGETTYAVAYAHHRQMADYLMRKQTD